MTASLSGNGKRAPAAPRRTSPLAALVDRWIPKLVLAPSVAISLVFVYGFILITGFLSLTNSRLMPRYEFVGLDRYAVASQRDGGRQQLRQREFARAVFLMRQREPRDRARHADR